MLEYLLGQHCATDDQAQLVKSTLKECGTHKVIDKLTVELNEKGGFYEGCCEGWQIISTVRHTLPRFTFYAHRQHL